MWALFPLLALVAPAVCGQNPLGPLGIPNLPAPPPVAQPAAPAAALRRAEIPSRSEVVVGALRQESEGGIYKLRGFARLETTEFLLRADEIDYNDVTKDAEARGNVFFVHYENGEEIRADRVEYNVRTESGKFFEISGTTPAKIDARPGVLTTNNPFYFEGKWAERIQNRYVLYDGFITNCRLPKPWWVLRGPKFDVIPNKRAIAYKSVFRLKKIPIFYAPVFYKSLEDMPRKSGFLTPNMGNSSRRGKMVGGGYYWAFSRSYDATYRAQYFTQRGVAHHVDLRGKPTAASDFNFILYGVNDRGLRLNDNTRIKQGGALMSFEGKADLGHGFQARADLNYLSSFTFRQAFTESFFEAIHSEVNSLAYITKHWSTYAFTAVATRHEVFLSTEPGDGIMVRKAPEVQFRGRDRKISDKVLPIWFSFDSSAGLVRRSQPLFQTRQWVQRADFEPRVMTALRWKGFTLLPSFGLGESFYGQSQLDGVVRGANIFRNAREVSVELLPPSLSRTFATPKWLGQKLKHVIEPRLGYRYVTGIQDFSDYVRFDDTELMSNTNEAVISLTNRFYLKRGDGQVHELLSWQLWQSRYFDPTFGGAVVAGERNVVKSSQRLTAYAFLSEPRNYSPVVSVMRVNPIPGAGVEWRLDYDPLRGGIVNSGVTADARFSRLFFVSAGHTRVKCVPLEHRAELFSASPCSDPAVNKLSPPTNEFRGLLGVGTEDRRGWSAAFSAVHDFRQGVMSFATTQVSYNTDCCGFSVQYRRFSFGTRNENQFRVAFVVANIGSFGTLKKQERIF